MAETQSLFQFCRCLDLTSTFSRFPSASPSCPTVAGGGKGEGEQEAWPTHKPHPIHAPFPQATPRAPLTAQGPALAPPQLASSPAPGARAGPRPRPRPPGLLLLGRRCAAVRGSKMAAQQQDREGGAQLAGPAAEADPLGRFTCPVCLEVYEKPVQVPCGHV